MTWEVALVLVTLVGCLPILVFEPTSTLGWPHPFHLGSYHPPSIPKGVPSIKGEEISLEAIWSLRHGRLMVRVPCSEEQLDPSFSSNRFILTRPSSGWACVSFFLAFMRQWYLNIVGHPFPLSLYVKANCLTHMEHYLTNLGQSCLIKLLLKFSLHKRSPRSLLTSIRALSPLWLTYPTRMPFLRFGLEKSLEIHQESYLGHPVILWVLSLYHLFF